MYQLDRKVEVKISETGVERIVPVYRYVSWLFSPGEKRNRGVSVSLPTKCTHCVYDSKLTFTAAVRK